MVLGEGLSSLIFGFRKPRIKEFVMPITQRHYADVEENLAQLQLAGEPEFAGRTLQNWDADWMLVKGGFTVVHSDLRHHVGLFRACLGGSNMYIGKAVEVDNGGLRKRLSDFRRESPSGREHHGAQRIYDHLDELDLQVLITGSDQRAKEIAELLKLAMIVRHLPPWNMEKEKPALETRAHVRVSLSKGQPSPSKGRPTFKLVAK